MLQRLAVAYLLVAMLDLLVARVHTDNLLVVSHNCCSFFFTMIKTASMWVSHWFCQYSQTHIIPHVIQGLTIVIIFVDFI